MTKEVLLKQFLTEILGLNIFMNKFYLLIPSAFPFLGSKDKGTSVPRDRQSWRMFSINMLESMMRKGFLTPRASFNKFKQHKAI